MLLCSGSAPLGDLLRFISVCYSYRPLLGISYCAQVFLLFVHMSVVLAFGLVVSTCQMIG